MKLLATLFFLFIFPAITYAEWQVHTRTDSMTDKTTELAVVINQQGYKLSVYRIKRDGEAWGAFELPGQMAEQIAPKTSIMYRVDKNAPRDFDFYLHSNLIHGYEWQPRSASFLLWHGNEDEGFSKSLTELMQGKQIVFMYYPITGGHTETVFSIAGAEKIISGVLGIGDVNSPEQQKIQELNADVVKYNKVCIDNPSTRRVCMRKILACKNSSTNDIDLFRQCMEAQ